MTTDKTFREILLYSFKNDTKKYYISLTNSLINCSPSREEIINKNLNYIINNYSSIKNMINFEIGSSMESHISHLIASPFSSRPKKFSSKYINKYLKINDFANNDINIFNLYLSSYNKNETITINNESLNYNNFKNNSNIPYLESTNIDHSIKLILLDIKTANAIL